MSRYLVLKNRNLIKQYLLKNCNRFCATLLNNQFKLSLSLPIFEINKFYMNLKSARKFLDNLKFKNELHSIPLKNCYSLSL